ncbi:hypothetical protein XELAEV_18033309mg [Xenopus laevis]|uniref:SGNH hydrolase-type esterase domain-containing protein n=1 Tax=Xenopus laevis TaxID=8355 RepID=A0A974CKJ8_XENLA|nr:hypothetical protein XELAEV_18033309mg [Xenopus laevis]
MGGYFNGTQLKAYRDIWIEWIQSGGSIGGRVDEQENLDRLLLYLAQQKEKGNSYNMINKRMSAPSYLFKLLNFKDVTKKFIVRQILRSYRKEQARKDRRRPISLSLLNKLFDELRGVCFSGYEENLFKLAFSLAFYGAFRISELVSKDKKGRGGLLLEDIQCFENHLSIYLKFSKTDVFGKGKMITLNRIKESPTCPAKMWGLDPRAIKKVGRWNSERYKLRADVRKDGRQLGFPRKELEISWLGKSGMCWHEVLPNIWDMISVGHFPHILVIHAGGNDLGAYPIKNLIKDMKRDIWELLSSIQGLILVWSEIIPRKVWRYARSHDALNRTRITINREMSHYVRGKGAIVIRHKDIEFQDDLLREDGVHLNKFGLEIFNVGIQEALEKALLVWKKMNS